MKCAGQTSGRLVSIESGGYRLPQERLPVRKIKEVLRLQALGLSQRQIALSCAVGQATVSDYLRAAETAGLKWADVADWDDDRLWKAVAPPRESPPHPTHSPHPTNPPLLPSLQNHTHHT